MPGLGLPDPVSHPEAVIDEQEGLEPDRSVEGLVCTPAEVAVDPAVDVVLADEAGPRGALPNVATTPPTSTSLVSPAPVLILNTSLLFS